MKANSTGREPWWIARPSGQFLGGQNWPESNRSRQSRDETSRPDRSPRHSTGDASDCGERQRRDAAATAGRSDPSGVGQRTRSSQVSSAACSGRPWLRQRSRSVNGCASKASRLCSPSATPRTGAAWEFIAGMSNGLCRGCISFVAYAFAMIAAPIFTKLLFLSLAV